MNKLEISVIVPVYNEEENITLLFKKIRESLLEFRKSFEVIFVNDGSTDSSCKVLAGICEGNQDVTVIDLIKNYGKAAALEQGFKTARGEYIVTIDSDLQYDPKDIPVLIRALEKGADVASVKRINRLDPMSTIAFSKVYNTLLRIVCGLPFDDYFSGFRCYKKYVLDYLNLNGNLIRFIPVFAFREGFKVVEIPLKHYPRIHGVSKYDFSKRFLLALLDIIVVLTMYTLNKNRMFFLGMGSLILLGVGITVLTLSFLLCGPEKSVLTNPFGVAGIIVTFLSVQTLILKKLWDAYFVRYHEGHEIRERNVKNISKSE
jgi:glycosyltransferase involved in cell wall biosynthesis